MRINIITSLLLLGFYVLLSYFIIGGLILPLLVMVIVIVFFMNASIYVLLQSDFINTQKYKNDYVLSVINVVHIFLIISFVLYIIIYDQSIGLDISPLTGHLLFLLSILVNIIILIRDFRLNCVKISLIIYLLAYGLFAFYMYIPYLILLTVFGYVVVHNIAVVSYGFLRYIPLFRTKKQSKSL